MNPNYNKDVIEERLAEYANQNVTEARTRLIELWRKHHPEAAKERSAYLHPLMLIAKRTKPQPPGPIHFPDEEWANDIYQVTLRRWTTDRVFGSSDGMIQLGINSLDGTARHDWRDFQAIKNQLVGPECEAFELYPAESRRLDPSNYYTLWCFPGVKRLKVGHEIRDVRDADEALAPQRALK